MAGSAEAAGSAARVRGHRCSDRLLLDACRRCRCAKTSSSVASGPSAALSSAGVPHGGDRALVDDGELVAQGVGLLHVVGRQKIVVPERSRSSSSRSHTLRRGRRIEADRGLVQEQHRGLVQHGLRDSRRRIMPPE